MFRIIARFILAFAIAIAIVTVAVTAALILNPADVFTALAGGFVMAIGAAWLIIE